MKNLLYLFLLSFFFYSCQDEDAPMDTETNKYYADYVEIYTAYDSVGNEGTLTALEGYLEEFPERHEAYVFKAYILAKMGKVDEANKFFNQARSMDSLAIESYEYQSAFMLYDSTKYDVTAAIIEQGLSVDDSSGHLMNNRAWLKILNGDLDGGFQDVNTGINMKPKTKNLYRTGYVISSLMENDSSKQFYGSKLESLGIDSPDSLENLLNSEGALGVLNSLF